MRVFVTSTMAASALAIGLQMEAAQSFSPGPPLGDRIASLGAPVQLVQQGGKQMSPGQGPSLGQGRGQGGAGPSLRQDGGGMRGDGGGMRRGGSQFRPGEKGLRGEFGYRNGGERRAGPRAGGRSGVYIEGERRPGRRGGVYFGPSYGYGPVSCGWLRRRAIATGSPYWWRRYHACRG